MFNKDNFYSLLLGFILGYSINYYNKKYIKDIINRLEIIETKHSFLNDNITNIKLKVFENKVSIKELNQKQEALTLMKKEKKRNKIHVEYDDIDFGIHTK